ncbi:TIGR01777 family oxidoreductase [Nocardioides acrostichi]|uniref:TIGR01777 family protein n=1 Tax=Nocardioides acrostichi TaxID=2784339 RepID=A0A930Y6F7_9ACTN|nr:TIGR01777 family oxidoreductase [Nocardioides acrostichi]MBF4162305.1 TIGR01777 family protein [Nocardioides acrostichi]
MSENLHVVVAGSSGFLGTHLLRTLQRRGHTTTSLVRRPTSEPGESTWDPYAGVYDRGVIASADVVINLAGSPLIGNVHSKQWAHDLRESRVTTTRVLAEAIAGAGDTSPAFLAGNGISFYGDHGGEPLPETADSRGDALLTSVTRDWQDAAQPAVEAGARVCILRTAPVMDARHAPLQWLKPLFKGGLGGKLGSGEQHMPMISLRDWVGAVAHLAESDTAHGPMNLCCATTPTNAEFTTSLGRALRRPTFATVPAVLLDKAAGAMAPELLGSVNAVPQALIDSGFEHADRDVVAVVAAGLAERDPA